MPSEFPTAAPSITAGPTSSKGSKKGNKGVGSRMVPVCTLNEKYGEFVTQCVDLDSLVVDDVSSSSSNKGSKRSSKSGLGKYSTFVQCGCCAEDLGEADPPEFCLAALGLTTPTTLSGISTNNNSNIEDFDKDFDEDDDEDFFDGSDRHDRYYFFEDEVGGRGGRKH